MQRKITSVLGFLRAAARRPGYERDDVLLLGKSVAAVVAAWSLASWLLPPQVTTFAPFTTLLALQATVYRSVWHSVQYVAAVGVGVVLATGFGVLAGLHAWSLAVMMLVALAASRLEVFGTLRLQVPVTALFAFAAGGGQVEYGLALVCAVGLGVGSGLAVALLLPPATHYPSADEAVAQLADGVRELLAEMAATLRKSAPDVDLDEDWSRRTERLETIARRARLTVEEEETKGRFNPRRSLAGAPAEMPGLHRVVTALERVAAQARSIRRGLGYAARSERYQDLAGDFLGPYAELLEEAAEAVAAYARAGRAWAGDAGVDTDELDARVAAAREHYAALADGDRRDHSRAPDEWPLYGGLLTDAHRIVEELDRTGAPR